MIAEVVVMNESQRPIYSWRGCR